MFFPPKIEIPSPSETSHHPEWFGESLMLPLPLCLQSCILIPCIIMLLVWWIVMHGPPETMLIDYIINF